MFITIKPKKNATRETKNRIHNHGPLFKIEQELPSVHCLKGKPGIRVSSKEKTWRLKPGAEKEHWMGWFSIEEIEVILQNS